jgi:polyisoprenoid-binding protein YceI
VARTIRRKDFGVTLKCGGDSLMGDEVKIKLDVEAVRR